MTDDVTNPAFWADRVKACGGDLQRAMFAGSPDQFSEAHADQLARLKQAEIAKTMSVLDVGCGYGRVLHMLGPDRPGLYVGVDVADRWVEVAKCLYPGRGFACIDFAKPTAAESVLAAYPKFDVAVAVWVKAMMDRNGLQSVWDRIEANMRKVAKRVVVVW